MSQTAVVARETGAGERFDPWHLVDLDGDQSRALCGEDMRGGSSNGAGDASGADVCSMCLLEADTQWPRGYDVA